MNLECLNGIIKDRLAIHIDISDINSWNLNTGFSTISLTKWSDAVSDNIELLDYGLTQFDNGFASNLYDSVTLTPQDLNFTLNRIGYNNATGGTFFDIYPISAVTTGSTIGNYFNLNGGYLQGFFKLENYNFEQFPARYNEGITIETLIRIDQFNNEIFYLMGSRAEDKYNPFFSGETELIITEQVETVPTGVVGQSTELITTITGFSGVSTSEGNFLNAFINTEVRNINYRQPEIDAFETIPILQQNNSTYDNIIAFFIKDDGAIGIKRIDENGLLNENISVNKITNTGWTIITIVFEPDEIINDPELLECFPARNGTLKMFVNGRLFWKINDYKEFFFRGMNNTKDKQIGVPYNISWGGGSFGLKHSWHYDINNVILYDENDTTYINNNFFVTVFPFKNDPCNKILDITNPNVGGISLSADSTTFIDPDICDPTTGTSITVMKIEYTGTTAQTTGQQYYIQFSGLTNILSNRDYEIFIDIYDPGIFRFGSDSEISLIVFGTEDIEIIEQTTYKGELSNKWVTLNTKFRLKENTALQSINIGLLINSTLILNDNFFFFVNNWNYKGSDIISQDSKKQDLLIEQNFDSSFIGAIQKLRIYDIAFNNNMVLHNAKIESNNSEYGIVINKGGRIINN